MDRRKNPTTYNLARMNMLLHGIRFSSFKIENGIRLNGMHSMLCGSMQWLQILRSLPNGSAAIALLNDDRFSKAGRLAP